MKQFISCDWGTSNLRLRLVDQDSASVLQETATNEGIAPVYQSWKNESAATDRAFYYLSVIKKHIDKWRDDDGELFLSDTPVVISGMASSGIGIMELDYAPMPMPADGSGLLVKKIDRLASFPFPVFIISGASSTIDVMRGEETLLAGCDTISGKEELFIFPGTHSKHVMVSNGIANAVATYMTGEFFSLLSRQSILAGSIQQPEEGKEDSFFERGIAEGSAMNLLNSVFKVRVNQLFKKASPFENFHYLSGLLIGAELSSVKEKDISLVTVVAGSALMNKYLTGLKLLKAGKKINNLDAGKALVKGQCKIISGIINQ